MWDRGGNPKGRVSNKSICNLSYRGYKRMRRWQLETFVAGFEDLIRGALRKHGGPTSEGRSVIYQSSRQALERMLSQNDKLDPAAQTYQRQRLEVAIAEIEAGYNAAPQVGFPEPAPVEPSPASVAPPTAPSAQVQSHYPNSDHGRIEHGFAQPPIPGPSGYPAPDANAG